jgi:AcrR family transcriptional regulator
VQVFWEHGYDGASLDGLTRAMGINRPSLYAEFGSKHGLFLAALDRYFATHSARQSLPLIEETDVRDAVEGYYNEIVRSVTSADHPSGCLIASVATEISERDAIVRKKVSDLLAQAEGLLDSRLAEAGYGPQEDGKAPKVTGAMIISAGLSFSPRARLGASRGELEVLARAFIDRFFDHRDQPETEKPGER